MIALLTNPAATNNPDFNSFAFQKRLQAAALSDEVWELHHILVDPVSRVDEVRLAKRQLLRQLRKTQTAVVSMESRRRSTAVSGSPKTLALP